MLDDKVFSPHKKDFGVISLDLAAEPEFRGGLAVAVDAFESGGRRVLAMSVSVDVHE